jgi:hypothetical protein
VQGRCRVEGGKGGGTEGRHLPWKRRQQANTCTDGGHGGVTEEVKIKEQKRRLAIASCRCCVVQARPLCIVNLSAQECGFRALEHCENHDGLLDRV